MAVSFCSAGDMSGSSVGGLWCRVVYSVLVWIVCLCGWSGLFVGYGGRVAV